jgi:hypothetical protein
MKTIKRILTGVLSAALFVFGFWFVTKTDFVFMKSGGFNSFLFIYFLVLFFLGGLALDEY